MPWAPDYVTVAELAAYLSIADDVDNAQLTLAVSAASRAIDRHTRRQFGKVAAGEARTYTPVFNRRRCRWVIKTDDLQDATGLAVQLDAGAVTAYTLEPVNAAQTGKPWRALAIDTDSTVKPTGAEHEAVITALWGWTAVPSAVKQATLLQASRFFNRRTSPYGIAGSPDQGSELRLLARVDPDVGVSLRDYTIHTPAVG